MDGIRTFISRNKISIIASLIVVFIGLIGVLFWEKFYKSNLIKKVEGKTYSFLYDDSWCVKKKSESLIRLEHRSSSIIKIEMVDLVGEYKYLTIDELIDEVSYRILKDNDKYKLISKMEDSFTMNRDNGYKMLYENKDKQVMVVTYKRGDKLIVISYEADSNYFDILLDSVQNIIYNFDYRDEKFALKSNIKLKLSEIEYGKGSKIEKLLEGVSSYEIFDNNYEVSFTIPNNFKLENLNTKTKNFDFEGLETGSIRLNSFIVNRNIYDYLDVNSTSGLYASYKAYKDEDKYDDFLEDITNLEGNSDSYIYKNSYKRDQDIFENIELVYSLNKNHILVLKIKASKWEIPKKLIEMIRLNKSKNCASNIKRVLKDGYLIGHIRRFKDSRREKTDDIVIKLSSRYVEEDKGNNLEEERYYGLDYSTDKKRYDYEVRYKLTDNYINDIDNQIMIIERMFKTAYGKYNLLKKDGELTVNNKKFMVYDGGYTEIDGIMFTDINNYYYYVFKKVLVYEVASGGYLIVEITGNDKEISSEIVNEVTNFLVEEKRGM